MRLKLIYRIGTDIIEVILDPDVPVVFYENFCGFTGIDGKVYSIPTKDLTGLSVIKGVEFFKELA